MMSRNSSSVFDAELSDRFFSFSAGLEGISHSNNSEIFLTFLNLPPLLMRKDSFTNSGSNFDIVVSEDEKSMLTENALRAYKLGGS